MVEVMVEVQSSAPGNIRMRTAEPEGAGHACCHPLCMVLLPAHAPWLSANLKQARTTTGQSQASTHKHWPITSKHALCMCMNHDGGGMACVHANNMNNIAPVVACTIEAHGLVPWHQACPSAAAAVPPATTNEPPPPLCKHGHGQACELPCKCKGPACAARGSGCM